MSAETDKLEAEIDSAVEAEVDSAMTEEPSEEKPVEEKSEEEKSKSGVVDEEQELKGESQERQGDTETEDDSDDKEESGESEEVQEEHEEQKKGEDVPVPPRLSDDAVARAIRIGFTLSEARSFRSEAALTSACHIAEQAKKFTNEQEQEEKPQKDQVKDEEDPLALFDKLDPETYDADFIKLMGAMADQVRAQREELRELRTNQEQSAQVNQEAAAREVKIWFDKQVKELGADFHETLGTGDYDSLSQGSPQLVKRDEIAEQMAVVLAGYQAMGQPAPPREEVFSQVAKQVLQDVFSKTERQKLEKDLRKRSKSHIQRTGSKGVKTESKDPTEDIAAEINKEFFDGK